jgi:hypothetical protein
LSELVHELLGGLATLTGASLLCTQGLEEIRIVEGLLPPCTGGVAFESHLGQRQPRVDLIVRVMRADRPALLRCTAARLAPARRFAESWTRTADLEHVPYVDLEFDLDGNERECFVGAMIEPHLHRGMARVPASGDRVWFDAVSSFALASAVLAAAEASPVAAELSPWIRRVFDALPLGGVIGHLGSLRCRQSDGGDLVRFIVSLPRRNLVSYLRSVGWPGAIDALKAALDRHLDPKAERVDIDMNVTAHGLTADTGFYRSMWNPRDDDVTGVVARLEADGLVTEAQATALAHFGASTAAPLRGIPWTMTFKTKLDGDGGVLAKAYLSLLATG